MAPTYKTTIVLGWFADMTETVEGVAISDRRDAAQLLVECLEQAGPDGLDWHEWYRQYEAEPVV